MLALGLVLTSLIAYFISSIFKEGLLFFLIFFASIVFNIQILSLFHNITPLNILILTGAEAVFALIVWLLNKHPLIKPDIKRFLSRVKEAYIQDKSFIFLIFGFLFLIFVSFFLALFTPVSEPDAQTYHAYRVLEWLKNGYISHFEAVDVRNLCMPFNSETVYLWILALTKKDIGYGMLQFASYFALIASFFKIMDFLEIDFKKQLFSIILFSSFPAIIIQISSTQTDILVSALISITIYFLMSYKKKNRASMLFFSALSMALSFGVKTTSFMVSIPIIVWLIFYLKKDFIKFFILLFINSCIFSSYSYILNFIDYGNFFSSNAFILYNKFYGGIKVYLANIFQYIVQMLDFTGLNLALYLNDNVLTFKETVLGLLNLPKEYGILDGMKIVNISMSEQKTAFGILGFFIFLPCSIAALFNKKLRLFGVLFWVPLLILCGLMIYTIYGIRYVVCFVALAIPVLTLSYTPKLTLIKFIAIIYMLFYMLWSSLFINSRPLVYLFSAYFRDKNIEVVQNKTRENRYRFASPYVAVESAIHRKLIEPNCKNGAKIGYFAHAITYFYDSKYLELQKDCSINILNPAHIKNYDLKQFDIILIQNNPVATTVLTKYDLQNPILEKDMADCEYLMRQTRVKEKTSIDKTMFLSCAINKDYISSLGFRKIKSDEYLTIDKELIKLIVWKNLHSM